MKRIAFFLLTTSTLLAAPETITWLVSDPGEGVTLYHLLWSTNQAGPFTEIASTPNNGSTGQNAVPGVVNYYQVVAENGCCKGDPSDTAFRPSVVMNLKIAGSHLGWTANPAPDGVLLYQIWSSPNAGGPWTLLTSVGANSCDCLPTGGKLFVYVVSINGFGASDPSAVAIKPGKVQNLKVSQ